MKRVIAWIVFGACLVSVAFGQIQSEGTPRAMSAGASYLPAAPTVGMPSQDNSAYLAEDAGLPKAEQNRFAAQIPVNMNLSNSGTWTMAPDGGRVWRLRIESPDAHSLALLFSEWYLPKGAELFVYNDNQDDVLGALTAFNNWVDGTNVIRHLKGDAITLELYEPAAVMNESVLTISTVCHAYRNYFGYAQRDALDNFGDSGACNNNILCPEASAWQDEKRGATMITSGGSRICSGSMIRANVATNWPAYYLTANHCGFSGSWVFVFNYESPQCSPNADGSTAQTVANATLRANWANSDFELLELSAHPPVAYNAYYNGWNRNDAASSSSVCIHHPRGDVKKWTIDNNSPTVTSYGGSSVPGDGTHWRIANWEDGTTEPGSSGSPLFDQNSRITGQLHGGTASCANNIDDYFGRLSVSWAGGGSSATRLSNWLDPNNTGATTVDGRYPITLANDNCPGNYVTLPFSGTGSTVSATASGSGCAYPETPDVWYFFYTSPCSSQVTVSLCNSSYDTFLEVRRGGNCPGDALVDCTDDDCGVGNLRSSATFSSLGQDIIYVRVLGWNGSVGDYQLDITETALDPVPANDNCSSPTFVTALPFTTTGSTCTAANDFSFCNMGLSNDVVYTVIVDECQSITASTCGGISNFDTRLTVRTDGNCPGTTELACSDDFCGVQSQVTWNATAGVPYYVVVGGFSTSSGRFTLNITGGGHIGAPANDNCSGSLPVNALPYSHAGNTACAFADYDFAGCGFEASHDVLYTLNVPSCQTVQVSLCSPNPSYDTRLQVMAGGSCPGNTLVACNDDNQCGGSFSFQSTVSFGALANTNYYILVRGFNSLSYGPYNLNVTSAGGYISTNDVCPGTAVNALPYTGFGNTVCSQDNYANGDCYFAENSPEDVYSLTLGSTQGVVISLCGSGYDTGLKVRRGGACPGDVMVVCDDDASCGGSSTLQSVVEFTAQAGVTYYVQVGGYENNTGPYSIRMEQKVLNPVDSLVIKEDGGFVRLNWEDNGAAYWTVYRSTDPATLFAPGNLMSFPPVNNWTDFSVLSTQYYYAVTYVPDYMVPALIAAGVGTRPAQEVMAAVYASLKLSADPVSDVEFYVGEIPACVELAPADKSETTTVLPAGIHLFGPGTSTEVSVPGKNYSAQ
ncbi:MAG: hypothetical protein IPK53_11930 [bacterium]|nr:hypothetical protein [bacterium]